MTIQSIMTRISPRYAKKQLIKKAQRLWPERAQQQEVVRNYVKAKASDYKQEYVCPISFEEYKALDINMYELHECSANDIIKFCKGDVAKIDKLLGAYGLAMYSGLAVDEVLPKYNKETDLKVKETGYFPEDTLDESVVEYMLQNQHGELIDFFERFGQVAKQAYHGFQSMGWTKTYINLNKQNGFFDTYRVNSRFVSGAHITRLGRELKHLCDV